MEVVNDNNASKFNSNHKKGMWLVWYFADWCGHCHSMKPEWDSLKNNNTHNVNLAKVRDDYQNKIGLDAPVQGYPTIILVKNGKVAKTFSGERTADSFNSFIEENSTMQERNANNSGIESMNNNVSNTQPKRKRKRKPSAKKKAANLNSKKSPQSSKSRRKSTKKSSKNKKKKKSN